MLMDARPPGLVWCGELKRRSSAGPSRHAQSKIGLADKRRMSFSKQTNDVYKDELREIISFDELVKKAQ